MPNIQDTQKYIFPLPTPKDEDLIKYINSQLKALEIHAVHIRTKKNKNEVHICGTDAYVKEGKEKVEKFIKEYRQPHTKVNKDKKQLQVKSTEGKIKVLLPYEAIPLGHMIGKGYSNINRITEETGASVDVIDKAIYVSGDGDQCKRAICEFRNIASDFMHRNLNKEYSCDTFDFVDSTGLKCDFKLNSVDCPHSKWDKTKCYYKITKVEEDEDEQNSDGEINIEELQNFISEVLQKIQAEHDGKIPKADLWCHFGHFYVGGRVDEDDVESPACINDFQAHFNQKQGGWKMLLDPAVKDMEIKHLEELLAGKPEDVTVANHVRYDLNFLTPLCLKVRVKFFLDLEGNPNIKFAEEDIDIREDTSLPSSIYLMCDDFYHRAKISIAIPSNYKLMDVRMTLRTVLPRKIHNEKEKEHEEILKKYFDKITINKDDSKLVFPDENLHEGFSLQFLRKCTRRSYRHQQGEESFSMTLSDEEEMDVIHVENVLNKKTDIHLHNDKWDQLLTSGDWKPEQIVDTLPTFLSVLKSVQANISAPEDDE